MLTGSPERSPSACHRACVYWSPGGRPGGRARGRGGQAAFGAGAFAAKGPMPQPTQHRITWTLPAGPCFCIGPALPCPWGGRRLGALSRWRSRSGQRAPLQGAFVQSSLGSWPGPPFFLAGLPPSGPVPGQRHSPPRPGHPDAPSSGTRAAGPAGAGSSGRVPVPGLVRQLQAPPGAGPAGLLPAPSSRLPAEHPLGGGQDGCGAPGLGS